MASGESAAERAEAKRAVATRYRLRADRAERAAVDWARGAQGESLLAEMMGPLGADGYYRLDDRRIPGSEANLDHVLLGPAGVFVIDAKSWSGRIWIDGKSLRQDHRRRDDHLERVRVQAVGVSTIVEELMGRRVEVRPVICFTGEAGLPSRTAVDRVHLFNADQLVPFIRGLDRRLDQAAVDQLMAGLLHRLPARTATAAEQPVVPPAATPHGLVLFLQPWSRQGHKRLYVKSSDGAEVGHLDLVTGEVQSVEDWRPVLAQLLPHYASDAPIGLQAVSLSPAAKGVLRRFIDAVRGRPDPAPLPVIFAGYHWKNYGKDRLYLHKVEAGGSKLDLGWFDLASGVAHSGSPESAGVLTYCGQRFRDTARQ